MNWLSIDSAPKTGDDLIAKPFLGWCHDPDFPDHDCVRIVWWEPLIEGGCWYGDRDLREHPTHWMTVPDGPGVFHVGQTVRVKTSGQEFEIVGIRKTIAGQTVYEFDGQIWKPEEIEAATGVTVQ